MANCEDCNNKGWVLSNDEDWNDEIQKCDSCNVFAHDEEAQMFVHFLGFDDKGGENNGSNIS